jgi:hypothetical protein
MFGRLEALVEDDALRRGQADSLARTATGFFLDAYALLFSLGFSRHVQRDRQNEKLACK